MVKSTTLDVTIGAVFIVFIIIGAICCCLSFIGGLVAIIMCNKNKSNQQPVQAAPSAMSSPIIIHQV